MFHSLLRLAEGLTAIGAIAGVGYCLAAIWAARAFLKSAPEPVGYTPPVSILKPLRGTDPGMYGAFRSHCQQDYAEYEIIFGVSTRGDTAVPLVEQLISEFPDRQIRLVACPEVLGANGKVSSLAQMSAVARNDHVIVNDSDMRVPHDYLRRVLAPFADPSVGMVTCLYRGAAGATFGSKLESLGISTEFAAGVLMARMLEGVRFGLGATVAMSRKALQAIGGFETLADYLADDYELGKRIAASGFGVRLSRVIVDTHLPDYSLAGFFQHQLRWGRGMRACRRWGYAGLGLTFAVPWALLTLLFSGGLTWAWLLLAVALGARAAMAVVVGRGVLQDRQVLRLLWLLPLRDLVGLAIWVGSLAGRTVAWRGERFILEDGKLRKAVAGQ